MALWLAAAGAGALERQGDRFVGDDGRPVLLAWAFGHPTTEQMPVYRDAGFNVLYVDLPARDGEAESLRRLAGQAADSGLMVVVGLNALDAVRPGGTLDPGDPAAVAETTDWIEETIAAWRDVPGLIGFGLQHEAEDRLDWTTSSFIGYLQRLYGDLDTLNLVWGSALKEWTEVNPAKVAELDEASAAGISRAAMDVARWRRDAAAGLLEIWTEAVQGAEPTKLVLGGRMGRLRSLMTAPASLGLLQPSTEPYSLRGRPAAFAAEMVGIAHQNGRRATVPVLSADLSAVGLAEAVPHALAAGACGVAHADWATLRAEPELLDTLRDWLRQARDGGWAGFRPRPATAVIVQPYARGPVSARRDQYGYGTFGGDEPAALLELMREGTRYGGVAAITPRDLLNTDLSQFGCLWAPSVLELSAAETAALRSYVANGGLLFADLGLSCYQPRGDLTDMSDELRDLFGVFPVEARPLYEVALREADWPRVFNAAPGQPVFGDLDATVSQPGSLRFRRRHHLLSSVQPVVYTSPVMSRSLLLSPAVFCVAADDTRVVAEQAQSALRVDGRPAVAGLTVATHGAGYALFWGTLAWQDWGLREPTFEATAEGLLGRQPELIVGDEPLAGGRVRAVRGGNGVWLQNLTGDPRDVELELPSHEPALLTGGFTLIQRPELMPDGPAPGTARWGFRLLDRRRLDAGWTGWLRLTPVTVWPQGAECSATLSEYGPEAVALTVTGPGEVRPQPGGGWQVDRPGRLELLIRIDDGAYRLEPGSLHRCEWNIRQQGLTGLESIRRTTTLTATNERALVLQQPVETIQVRITPVRDRPAAPGAVGP